MKLNGLYKKEQLLIDVANLDKDTLYEVEIKTFSEKRRLTQNAYYWVLVNKLANILRISKDELHDRLIKRYSQREYVSLLSNIKPESYFPYFEYKSSYKIGERIFNTFLIFKRSSEMSKTEFGILLDGLISECKEVGIETRTPDEIAQMRHIEEKRY